MIRLAEESHRQPLSEFSKQIPYALLATLVAAPEDDARHTQYARVFPTLCCADTTLLYNLVNAGFDAILTTNYTYEIENCFKPDYSALKNKAAYAFEVERQGDTIGDAKYLLHTYNQLADGPPIWHIHGEARRKSSIILTHDEYARLIHKLVEENKRNRNKFVEFETEVRYSSWLDYFLMSNLYIVGLGMDFSEFDLWWILNRRKREKARVGQIKLFAPGDLAPAVKSALLALDVDVIQYPDIPPGDHIGLYKRATEEIHKDLNTVKGV